MGFATFGELKTYAMDQLSEEETDAVFQKNLLSRWAVRTRDRINQHASFAFKEGLTRLTFPGIDFTNNQQITSVLYLPEDMDHILSMYPSNLQYREAVKIMKRWEFDQDRPGSTVVGAQDILVLWGYYGVRRDNPTTTQLTVEALGATPANAENIVARITGRDSDNEEATESVTLDVAGTATTTKTYLGGTGLDGVRRFQLDRDSLSGKTAGYGPIVLKSGGTVLQSLDAEAGEIAKEHRRTELYAQIGGPGDYNVAFYRRYKSLLNDSDSFLPELPNEFSDLVEDGIMMHIAEFRKEWDTMKVKKMMFDERLRHLVAYDNRNPGYKGRFTVRRYQGRGSYMRR